MKVLFQKRGKHFYLVDEEKMIFCLDGQYYDRDGNPVFYEEPPKAFEDDEDEGWYAPWMDDEGLDEPLKSESVEEIQWEIDDGFGKFGFRNEEGEFVIEPQYAYAHEFTNGLAAVNLNRTWYKTKDGRRFYENHYGYIDGNGKTVIPFKYDEAYPFNKYGVAVVSEPNSVWYLIDKEGKEIPGTRFPYLSHYYDYDERFLEFGYDEYGDDLMGIYDTKERKILFEPMFDDVTECGDDCWLIYERSEKFNGSDFYQHYRNNKGEILYPWLYGKEFAIVTRPDVHGISAVAKSVYTELEGNPRSYFPHNGKKYERKFHYGLYSKNEQFLLPMEYDEVKHLGKDLWVCFRDGIVAVVQTEVSD